MKIVPQEIVELRERILKGIGLASKRMIAEKKREHKAIVIYANGKIEEKQF